jgi:hypothetical protein
LALASVVQFSGNSQFDKTAFLAAELVSQKCDIPRFSIQKIAFGSHKIVWGLGLRHTTPFLATLIVIPSNLDVIVIITLCFAIHTELTDS